MKVNITAKALRNNNNVYLIEINFLRDLYKGVILVILVI